MDQGPVGLQTNISTNKQRKILLKVEESKAQSGIIIKGSKRSIDAVKKAWDKSFKFKLREPLK